MTAKVMIVDDNSATRRMVRGALAKAGHEVVEAADGRSARELMAREQPQVVLQDLRLPDIDGCDLVGELRALARDQVAILAFSGFVSKLDDARISAAGFDDVIPKPIAPSRLVPLVESHLPKVVPSDARFGAGRRIVVADDDPLQLKLAGWKLARLGFEVEAVPDGAAALEAIRARRPDAVVSDVMMPELDGFELALALREDPKLRGLPLVLVTSSYIEPNDRVLARRAGANDLVVRTPELGELVEILRATLSTGAGELPAPVAEEVHDLERERSRRVMRQLERQVMLNTGLAQRCSALASELAVIAGISEAVLRDRDVDVALDEALAACFDAGGVSVGALYTVGPDDKLRARPVGGEPVLPAAELANFFGHEDLLREVIASREALHVPSSQVTAAVAAELLARCSASALRVQPLPGARGPAGALLMIARGREVERDDWSAFGLGVATQIGQVLTLAHAYADREAAEQGAARQAALLQALVENAPDVILQVAVDGTVLYANRAVRGREPRDIVGKSWFDILPRHQGAEIRAIFERVAQTGEPGGYETDGVTPDGGPGTYAVRLAAARHDGKVVAIVIAARDVTERKRTEMQLMFADRMASVGTLAAGVAHEINNPLAALIANLDMAVQDIVELAKRGPLPTDLAAELHDARVSAERVREIVRDLKIFSRTEEDRRGAVDVEKVLESTLRMAWNELRHRARLVKKYGKVPRVDANESRIGQVFLNLIVNAAQAIPEGNYLGNEIRIATFVEDGRVVVSIADTGPGIPAEVQPRLFTPFFTTKPVGVGTGLGLAISHRIVTSLGGSITFTTRAGEGTEFRVALPIAAAQGLPTTQPMAMEQTAVRRARVLVIDDEESLGHAVRRFLAADHDVEAVTSAKDALDLFARGARYDVILCDLMMPQITGMELHAELMRVERGQAERIIFVTGGAFTATAREFLDTVPNRRLEKPFDLKALRRLIHEIVSAAGTGEPKP